MLFFIEAFSTDIRRPSFVSSKPYTTLKEAEEARIQKQEDFPFQDGIDHQPPTEYILFTRKAQSLFHAQQRQKYILNHMKRLW